MSLELQNQEEKILNDSWILWYHDPNDVNWELKSYKQVSEIKTISDFWNTYEFIQNKEYDLNLGFGLTKLIYYWTLKLLFLDKLED